MTEFLVFAFRKMVGGLEKMNIFYLIVLKFSL